MDQEFVYKVVNFYDHCHEEVIYEVSDDDVKYFSTFEGAHSYAGGAGGGSAVTALRLPPMEDLPAGTKENPMKRDGYDFLKWAESASIEELEDFAGQRVSKGSINPFANCPSITSWG